jgi:uncharacterized alpha/beta hydrolase family protein
MNKLVFVAIVIIFIILIILIIWSEGSKAKQADIKKQSSKVMITMKDGTTNIYAFSGDHEELIAGVKSNDKKYEKFLIVSLGPNDRRIILEQ